MDTEPTQPSPEIQPEDKSSDVVPKNGSSSRSGLSLAVFYFILAAWILWTNDTTKPLLKEYWYIYAGLFVAVLGALLITSVQRTLIAATAKTRIRWIVFGGLPSLVLVYLVIAELIVPEEYVITSFRIPFIFIATLFPAVMYYLFIATRRASLLIEFISNLHRLGLLTEQHFLIYLQRFEAVFGPTNPDAITQAAFPEIRWTSQDGLNNADPSQISRREGLAGIFTPETTIPLVFATTVFAMGWMLTLPPWGGDGFEGPLGTDGNPLWTEWLAPDATPANFAFLGAYFFSLQTLFRRYVRRDLRPSAYVAVSLRIIIAFILTWVVEKYVLSTSGGSTLGLSSQLYIIGFVIGAFPPVGWQLIQSTLKKFPGATLAVPSLESQMPLSKLDGLTVWHLARLEEEDIENIPNMATADLVDLMLHTRIPPDRIIDWVDQAILYTHLGPEDDGKSSRHKALRSHGIRTATSLLAAYDGSKTRGDVEELVKILPGKNTDRSEFISLVDTVVSSPNLNQIIYWKQHSPHVQLENE